MKREKKEYIYGTKTHFSLSLSYDFVLCFGGKAFLNSISYAIRIYKLHFPADDANFEHKTHFCAEEFIVVKIRVAEIGEKVGFFFYENSNAVCFGYL